MRLKAVCFVIVSVLAGCSQPEKRAHAVVFDRLELINPTEEQQLVALIEDFEQRAGAQIGLLITDTVADESMEDFSARMAKYMCPGRKGKRDGVLITIAFNPQRVIIEVGEGLRQIVTPDVVDKVTASRIEPALNDGHYYVAALSGITSMIEVIESKKDKIGKPL